MAGAKLQPCVPNDAGVSDNSPRTVAGRCLWCCCWLGNMVWRSFCSHRYTTYRSLAAHEWPQHVPCIARAVTNLITDVSSEVSSHDYWEWMLKKYGSIKAAVEHSCIARLTPKLKNVLPISELYCCIVYMYCDASWVGMQL